MTVCLAIVKNKSTNVTLGAKLLMNSGNIVILKTSDLCKLRHSLLLDNAIIDSRGYARGIKGSALPVEYADTEKAKPVLLEKIYTHTSKGMLSKGWYAINGGIYLVKGAYKNEYNPLAELIGSQIAYLVSDKNAVLYKLDNKAKYPEIKSDFKYVSLCEKWSHNATQQFYRYAELRSNKRITDYFGWICRNCGKKQLHDLSMMLFIDALIGNQDRHLGNFEVDVKTGNFTKIIDFGGSCLADYPTKRYRIKGLAPDKCKPFGDTHMQQMRRVKTLLARDSQKLIVPDVEQVVRKVMSDNKALLCSVSNNYYTELNTYLLNRAAVFTKEMRNYLIWR